MRGYKGWRNFREIVKSEREIRGSTSENPQKAKFAEVQKGEVRRLYLPRTAV
jgi:hypothetical protein